MNNLKNIYFPKKYFPVNLINNEEDCILSFLIPVYNAEKTIRKCIDSVLNQNTKYDYNIVIVNDGSNDNTEEIIFEYLRKNKNIIYHYQENSGISSARNSLLKLTNSKYISFLDSDDYISDNFVEDTLSKIILEDLDYVKTNYASVNLDSTINFTTNYNENTKFLELDRYLWGSVIKKSLYYGVSFPFDYWFEDMIFSFLVLSKVKKYAIVDKSLYYYVNIPQSASKIQGGKKNVKNLDQYYLVYYLMNYYLKTKQKLNKFQEYILINELSVMLMIRTRKLPVYTRKQVFLASCEIINSINFEQKFWELKIFENHKFLLWNLNAIIKRVLKSK